MSKFWPQRPEPKGFSIENLARKYRDRISQTKFNSNSEKALIKNKDKSISNIDSKINLSPDNYHWANRDFSEYRNIA